MSKNWSVTIKEDGPGGSIVYAEGQNKISFTWEFSGGNSVAMIWGPKEDKWAANYAWAAERRAEIFERVAQEAIKQKAPSCQFKIDLKSGTIDLHN